MSRVYASVLANILGYFQSYSECLEQTELQLRN